MKLTYYMGALVRREFRRVLQRQGLAFTEDKSWVDSQFVVEASREWHMTMNREIKRLAAPSPGNETYCISIGNGKAYPNDTDVECNTLRDGKDDA